MFVLSARQVVAVPAGHIAYINAGTDAQSRVFCRLHLIHLVKAWCVGLLPGPSVLVLLNRDPFVLFLASSPH
jgi:hypothetical protein